MTYYNCPVCGYDQLTKPPMDFYICPCCGTEFGLDDDEQTHQELRNEWIAKDMRWFSQAALPPKEWSPYRQLIIADHRSDLTGHPRFRSDFEYRFAVNTAFAEVRIAKQLKVLRDTRTPPLTQLQLAEKADMKQSRISELEGMNYSSWSISTIERLAKAMGLGIKYSVAGWGEIVAEIEGGLSREELYVPAFEDDPAFKGATEPSRKSLPLVTEAMTRLHEKLKQLKTQNSDKPQVSNVAYLAEHRDKRQPKQADDESEQNRLEVFAKYATGR